MFASVAFSIDATVSSAAAAAAPACRMIGLVVRRGNQLCQPLLFFRFQFYVFFFSFNLFLFLETALIPVLSPIWLFGFLNYNQEAPTSHHRGGGLVPCSIILTPFPGGGWARGGGSRKCIMCNAPPSRIKWMKILPALLGKKQASKRILSVLIDLSYLFKNCQKLQVLAVAKIHYLFAEILHEFDI